MLFWLFLLGIVTGFLSYFFGVGGGFIIVPALTLLGFSVINAAATSLVGVLLTAISGSLINWWNRYLNWRVCGQIALVGIPAAQVGAWVGDRIKDRWLALIFSGLLLLTIYLIYWRESLNQDLDNPAEETEVATISSAPFSRWEFAQIGAIAGVMSGIFGIGGGIVMVPLQIILLGESIKTAAPTSLGAMVAIAASGLIQHTWHHHVLWIPGICLGIGGIIGVQLGSWLLPNMATTWINRWFQFFLVLLALYMLGKGGLRF
jgi:hypothetical protein